MENESSIFARIKNIKSILILRKVFSLLNEKTKLSISYHNKKIEKDLSISINDYIKVSQKYRIIQPNGKGQEFLINTKYLIFEGEFKKGKKHGKGIEYYYNMDLKLDEGYLYWEKEEHNKNDFYKKQIKFEGEYFDGKKISGKGYDNKGNIELIIENGKGEEYYFDDFTLQFQGEYKDGKRWNGKGNNYDEDEVFEIKNGKGKGKIYNRNGNLIYKGDYLNGVRNGKGKEYYESGKTLLEGEFYNGKKINGKKYDEKGNIILSLENSKGKKYVYYDDTKFLVFEGEYLFWNKIGKR